MATIGALVFFGTAGLVWLFFLFVNACNFLDDPVPLIGQLVCTVMVVGFFMMLFGSAGLA